MKIMFKRPDGSYLKTIFNSDAFNNEDKNNKDSFYMFIRNRGKLFAWTLDEGVFEITALDNVSFSNEKNIDSLRYVLAVKNIDLDTIMRVCNHYCKISEDEVINAMADKINNNTQNINSTSKIKEIKEYGKHLDKDKFIEWLLEKLSTLMADEAKTI